ncbi:hypothetical protein DXG03_001280, partial [Asterophora parasitica]
MKFAPVILLAFAACAVAAPVSHSARGETDIETIIARAADIAAELHELLARAPLSTETELEARGSHESKEEAKKKGKEKGKETSKEKSKEKSKASLQITFSDPTGPISAERKAATTKHLKKYLAKADPESNYPYCSVEFSRGGHATYRCFSSPAKKISEQGPAGAIN